MGSGVEGYGGGGDHLKKWQRKRTSIILQGETLDILSAGRGALFERPLQSDSRDSGDTGLVPFPFKNEDDPYLERQT